MQQLKIKYQSVSTLVRNLRNTRLHSAEQVQSIADSIREFGFTNPILVDGDNNIIAGHGRLEAAKVIGLSKVPTIDLGHLSAEQKRAYAIADNKIPLGASWDMDLLKAELEALDVSGFDLKLTGFDVSELDTLLANANALMATAAPPVPVQQIKPAKADEELDEVERDDAWDGLDDENATDNDASDGGEFEEPEQVQRNPLPSDRKYSKFELVMEHPNKLLLVETLNNIRQKRHYEKLEDALMHLIKAYNEGKLEA